MLEKFKNLFKKNESESIHDLLKKHESKFTHAPIELDTGLVGNYQLDNIALNNIPASAQCSVTTISVLLSKHIDKAKSDLFIKEVFDKFDSSYIAKGGYRFTASMDNHISIYDYYIKKFDLPLEVVFVPHSGTIDDIINVIKTGEGVEVSWMPTSHGHYSPIVGYSEIRKSFKVADPYKRFDFKVGKYTNESGLNAWYPVLDFYKYLEKSSLSASGGKYKGIRYCYLRSKK